MLWANAMPITIESPLVERVWTTPNPNPGLWNHIQDGRDGPLRRGFLGWPLPYDYPGKMTQATSLHSSESLCVCNFVVQPPGCTDGNKALIVELFLQGWSCGGLQAGKSIGLGWYFLLSAHKGAAGQYRLSASTALRLNVEWARDALEGPAESGQRS